MNMGFIYNEFLVFGRMSTSWLPGTIAFASSRNPRDDRTTRETALNQSKNFGFTLIELLVVIAIIALLSSVVAVSLSSARMKARDAQRIATARQIRIALGMYESDTGTVQIAGAGMNSDGQGPILKGATTIMSELIAKGQFSRAIAPDPVFGTEQWYIGLCTSTSPYIANVYVRVERPENSIATTTLASSCGASTAASLGYNFAISGTANVALTPPPPTGTSTAFGPATDIVTSITIGNDNNPIIAYGASGALNVLKCGNTSCTSGNINTPLGMGAGTAGFYILSAPDGRPIISSRDPTSMYVRMNKCANTSCTSLSASADISSGNTQMISHQGLFMGGDNIPGIVYRRSSDGNLIFQKCTSTDCSSASSASVVNAANSSHYAVTKLSDGFPGILLTSGSQPTFIKCTTQDCSGQISSPISPFSMSSPSLTVGVSNYPIFSYYNYSQQDLVFARCANLGCSSITNTTIDSVGDIGPYNSIKLGADSLPVMSYYDVTNANLKVAHCGNADCSAGNTITTIDSIGDVGKNNSLAIGSDGNPVISYFDATNNKLKIYKCTDAACAVK